jgi:hypothetical protein
MVDANKPINGFSMQDSEFDPSLKEMQPPNLAGCIVTSGC